MKTIATTSDAIIAIDLGKYKNVVCVYHSAENVRFLTFTTRRAELANGINKHRPSVVLIEACLRCGRRHMSQSAECLPCRRFDVSPFAPGSWSP